MSTDFLIPYDLSDVSYLGLTDTATGFTGSSTLQDVQAGSPLVLDTAPMMNLPLESQNTASVTDLLPQVPTSTWNPTGADMSQMLSGISDTPPSPISQAASSNTSSVSPADPSAWNAIAALGKFGSGIANLFSGANATVAARPNLQYTATGAPAAPYSGYQSGSFMTIALLIFGVLIFLMVRSD